MSSNEGSAESTANLVTINGLPNELIDKIFRLLSFETIAKNRVVRHLLLTLNCIESKLMIIMIRSANDSIKLGVKY